jgi:hypothetical protein
MTETGDPWQPEERPIRSGHSSYGENGDERPDDELTDLLVAYDEALSVGSTELSIDTTASSVDPELAAEIEQAKECLELLERVWPRSRLTRTPCERSPLAPMDGPWPALAMTPK